MNIGRLMLYGEISVCLLCHKEHLTALCGEKVLSYEVLQRLVYIITTALYTVNPGRR